MPLTIGRTHLVRRSPGQGFGRFCDAQGFGMLLRRQAERLHVAVAAAIA